MILKLLEQKWLFGCSSFSVYNLYEDDREESYLVDGFM